jgi:AcrR family transcriptional regulator
VAVNSGHGRRRTAGTRGARHHSGSVGEIQRVRILSAATAVVEEEGYSLLTVGKVVERARVSRKTFYELFEDRDACFLAVFDVTLARAREAIEAAYRSEPDWRGGMRAGVFTLLALMDQEPGQARLCIVEGLAAGQPVLERRADVLAAAARAVDLGRGLAPPDREPEPLTGHAVAGGIAELVHAQLLREDYSSATQLLGVIMSMIVMPYLGRSAAHEESVAPLPRTAVLPAAKPARDGESPLAGLDIRLTYRTVRVLLAIADTPGASNRQIAMDAGIVDQGQISKLLRRLEHLGLVENTGAGQAKGGSNAWRLTPLGARVRRAAQGAE